MNMNQSFIANQTLKLLSDKEAIAVIVSKLGSVVSETNFDYCESFLESDKVNRTFISLGDDALVVGTLPSNMSI